MVSQGDTYLILLDPDGQPVAQNDDYNGLNSKIERYRLQSSGEYTIIATSYNTTAQFTYSLRLRLLFSPEEMIDATSTLVGTQNGNTALYTDEVEAGGTLVQALGGGTFVSGRTHEAYEDTVEEQGRFENGIASGRAAIVGGDTTTLRGVFVFEDADDIDTADIEDWADDATGFKDANNIDVSTKANAAIVTGEVDTDDLANL